MQFTIVFSILAAAAATVTAVPTMPGEVQEAARARFAELHSRGITVKRDGTLEVRDNCIWEDNEVGDLSRCDACLAQNMDGGCGSDSLGAQFGCEMGNIAYCAAFCC